MLMENRMVQIEDILRILTRIPSEGGGEVAMGRDYDARIYPCKDCGLMRSKAEGGTTFTVCDACWDKHFKPAKQWGWNEADMGRIAFELSNERQGDHFDGAMKALRFVAAHPPAAKVAVSRDYKALYDHISRHGKALGYVDYDRLGTGHVEPTPCGISMRSGHWALDYHENWKQSQSKQDFIAECTRLNLEWVHREERMGDLTKLAQVLVDAIQGEAVRCGDGFCQKSTAALSLAKEHGITPNND
jgi:hypothetical protein